MKRKFSKSWKSSKKPAKQRKYAAQAPLHLKRKLLSINLSKELREKIGRRNIVIRKGDTVKILRGKFKGKKGKILSVNIKLLRIEIENIQIKKQDGSKSNIPIKASNMQIVELNLDDKKRSKKILKKVESKPEKEKKVTLKKDETKTKVGENK